MQHNANIDKLVGVYPFSALTKRVREVEASGVDVIRLHIGDVLGPITSSPADLMEAEIKRQSQRDSFRGYQNEAGIDDTREIVADYISRLAGKEILPEEVFITYGIKDEIPILMWLFDRNSNFAIERPVYPAYEGVITICSAGNITYMDCNEDNDFIPDLPDKDVDIMFLNRPNNPTGAGMTLTQYQDRVDWANKNGAIIVQDSAYSVFGENEYPKSILAAEDAKCCCIEMFSLSKSHAATAMRSGAVIIPRELQCSSTDDLYTKWTTMIGFMKNGVGLENQAFIRGALSQSGLRESHEAIDEYKDSGELLNAGFRDQGYTVKGGENAPYSLIKTPNGMTGNDLAEIFLSQQGVAVAPTEIFNLPGWVRIHHFITAERSKEALDRIAKVSL